MICNNFVYWDQVSPRDLILERDPLPHNDPIPLRDPILKKIRISTSKIRFGSRAKSLDSWIPLFGIRSSTRRDAFVSDENGYFAFSPFLWLGA